jgi:hypothetical protein
MSEGNILKFGLTKMLEFFIDNITVIFGAQVFQKYAGSPMGMNCAPFVS